MYRAGIPISDADLARVVANAVGAVVPVPWTASETSRSAILAAIRSAYVSECLALSRRCDGSLFTRLFLLRRLTHTATDPTELFRVWEQMALLFIDPRSARSKLLGLNDTALGHIAIQCAIHSHNSRIGAIRGGLPSDSLQAEQTYRVLSFSQSDEVRAAVAQGTWIDPNDEPLGRELMELVPLSTDVPFASAGKAALDIPIQLPDPSPGVRHPLRLLQLALLDCARIEADHEIEKRALVMTKQFDILSVGVSGGNPSELASLLRRDDEAGEALRVAVCEYRECVNCHSPTLLNWLQAPTIGSWRTKTLQALSEHPASFQSSLSSNHDIGPGAASPVVRSDGPFVAKMEERASLKCIRCGQSVTSTFCPHCGAAQNLATTLGTTLAPILLAGAMTAAALILRYGVGPEMISAHDGTGDDTMEWALTIGAYPMVRRGFLFVALLCGALVAGVPHRKTSEGRVAIAGALAAVLGLVSGAAFYAREGEAGWNTVLPVIFAATLGVVVLNPITDVVLSTRLGGKAFGWLVEMPWWLRFVVVVPIVTIVTTVAVWLVCILAFAALVLLFVASTVTGVFKSFAESSGQNAWQPLFNATTPAVGKIYRGDSTWPSDQIATFESGKIYRGDSTWPSDLVGTIEGGKVYRGDSTWPNDQVGTIEGGKVYRGDSTWPNDQVGTIEGGKVYRGDSTWPNDQFATVEGGEATVEAAAAYMLLL